MSSEGVGASSGPPRLAVEKSGDSAAGGLIPGGVNPPGGVSGTVISGEVMSGAVISAGGELAAATAVPMLSGNVNPPAGDVAAEEIAAGDAAGLASLGSRPMESRLGTVSPPGFLASDSAYDDPPGVGAGGAKPV